MSDYQRINVTDIYIKGVALLNKKTGKINKCFLPMEEKKDTIVKIYEIYENDKIKFRFD